MNIAIMSSMPATLAWLFVERHFSTLKERHIHVRVIIVDENIARKNGFFSHALNVARRQAKIVNCSTMMSFLKICTFKVITSSSPEAMYEISEEIRVVKVPTLNSGLAIEAVSENDCDLICLMGTRIVTSETLRALKRPIVNIHTSDPRFVRGGPAVVWEILAGHCEIVLTIHQVVAKLDAGAILMQDVQPIIYSGGLGKTIQNTMVSAQPKIADLFKEVILRFQDGTLDHKTFPPGPLRVTPKIRETLRAQMLCRLRTVEAG